MGDNHGGVCVYVDNTLYAKRRNDLELQNIECVWIEVSLHGKKILIGTFYRPPNSTNETLTVIENSIGLANDTNIQDILVTGDFNLDILKQNTNRKISNICQYFGLTSLITEPTHFTETSSSLIDLFLTSNKTNVLLSGVGEPFLEQNIRYHCPIYCVFKFRKKASPFFSRHIWLYDRGDYESFSRDVLDTNWDIFKSDNIDMYANNITERIIKLAEEHIPNKTVKVSQSDPVWFNNEIKKLIRKRKRNFDKFKRTANPNDFERYKLARNKVTSEIRKSKKLQMDKLAEKLKSNTIGPKDWWKTLKHVIKPTQTSSISPLNMEDRKSVV